MDDFPYTPPEALREWAALREALQQATDNGAPPEVIADLQSKFELADATARVHYLAKRVDVGPEGEQYGDFKARLRELNAARAALHALRKAVTP